MRRWTQLCTELHIVQKKPAKEKSEEGLWKGAETICSSLQQVLGFIIKKSSRSTQRPVEAKHKEAFGTSEDKMTFQQGVSWRQEEKKVNSLGR